MRSSRIKKYSSWHGINEERTNDDVGTILSRFNINLINPGNAVTTVASWSLCLLAMRISTSRCVGVPHRTNISIVTTLTTLEACGASSSALACRSRWGASGVQPDEYVVSPMVYTELFVVLLQDELMYPVVEHSEDGCYYSPAPG
jgi:hypothetical protein